VSGIRHFIIQIYHALLTQSRSFKRFIEFFTANIRNRNTRRAYAHAASEFAAWCEQNGLRELREWRRLLNLQGVSLGVIVAPLTETAANEYGTGGGELVTDHSQVQARPDWRARTPELLITMARLAAELSS
jgi:hypothetical protein